ncbi:MAG: PKD domain-containing protein [Thermoplasmata archaeon]|nr:PKD domain-containing protein [Thermoplasmata archaeon]
MRVEMKTGLVVLMLFAIAYSLSVSGEENIYFYWESVDGYTVNFTSCYAGGDNYTWHFGDGGIAYGKEVTHVYSSTGIYNVNLTIRDDGYVIYSNKMIATGGNPPTANFTWQPETPYSYDEITFWSDSEGNIINWSWNFGDGSVAYGKIVFHHYTHAGKYDVTLRVVDNTSRAAGITKQIIVMNIPPKANFFWTREGNETLFYDFSTDIDGTIVNYTWHFGDGSVAYGKNVEHVFNPGKYNVTLTIRDDCNATSTAWRIVDTRNEIPVADFTWQPEHPNDLQDVHFIDESYDDGVIVNYTWNFGDGSVAYGKNVTHRYADNGNYTVKLTVYDDEGAFGSVEKNIAIANVPPHAIFTWQPEHPLPNKIIFFNSSSYDDDGSIVNYTWHFGDGGIAYGRNVTHTYLQHGVYNVTLIITDNDGAVNETSVNIFVADIYVIKGVSDPANNIWNNIKDAINNASDGAWIYVGNGTYEGGIAVNKSVILIGEGNVIIDGSDVAFNITANDVFIWRFTFNGSVIFTGNNSIINNATFLKKVYFNGYGNSIWNSTLNYTCFMNGGYGKIKNSTIYGNISLNSYGNEIKENNISGTIFVNKDSNYISHNYIHSSKYGIYMDGATSFIDNNTFIKNEYGIFSTTDVVVSNSYFEGNNISIYGKWNVSASNCEFYNNSIGINGSTVECYYSIFDDEYGIIGGDILADEMEIMNSIEAITGENVRIYNSIICNNSVGVNSTFIEARNTTFCYNNVAIISSGVINNCTISHNQYGVTGNGIDVEGSIFNNNKYAVKISGNIRNSTFNSNEYGVSFLSDGNVISNCNFTSNSHAIRLYASDNNVIENNTVCNNEYGIEIVSSMHNTFLNNTIDGNTYSMDISGNEAKYFHHTMKGNTVNGENVSYLIGVSDININSSYGFIVIVDSTNITVENQSIHNNGKGIIVVNSSFIKIMKSKFHDSLVSIYVLKSNNIAIFNLSVVTSIYGIAISSSYHVDLYDVTMENNTYGTKIFDISNNDNDINIRECEFKNNGMGVIIQNAGGIEVHGSSMKKIKMDNSKSVFIDGNKYDEIIARHSVVNIQNAVIGMINDDASNIYLRKCNVSSGELNDDDITIEESILSGSFNFFNATISMYMCNIDSSNVMIEDSVLSIRNSMIYNNSGIVINSSNGNISYSEIFDNSIIESDGVTLFNDSFYNNTCGAILSNSLIYGGEIFNNTCGVVLRNGSQIKMTLLHHNIYGIKVEGNNSTILNNSFWKNYYGLVVYGNNNTIVHNNFVYNVKNAGDYGENNVWNLSYPAGGNYWDDYAGKDEYKGKAQNESGSDGIGDIPYVIDNLVDHYPFMLPLNNTAEMPNIPPVANFTFYPSIPYSHDEIIFMDGSDDANGKMDIISWHWDFGDGNTSTQQNPQHNYSRPGVYNVTLTVKDRKGGESTITKKIKINDIPPVANFTLQPENASSYTIIIMLSNSYDIDGVIVNYTWHFGDGSVAYGSNVSHTYTKPGIYVVTLKVTDEFGNFTIASKTVKINNKLPDADFDFNPEKPKAGEKVKFNDMSSDIDGKIVSWHWDFGDGTASNDQNPEHVYSKAGAYVVKLTVRDDAGGEKTLTKTITVEEKETPGFEIISFALAAIIAVVWMRRKFK